MADSLDTTTPSRRNFLRLVSAPAAGMAAAKLIELTPLQGDDRDVLKAAASARRLQLAEQVAFARYCKADDKFNARLAPRPPEPTKEAVNEACMEVLCAFPVMTSAAYKAVFDKREATEARMWAERDAWNREFDRLKKQLGVQEADDEHGRARDREIASVRDLTALRATTIPGIVAKASAVVVNENDNNLFDEHHAELVVSIVRDLLNLSSLSA